MSFPREAIDQARTSTATAVNGLLEWVDRLDGLTRTQAGQIATLTAERDAARTEADRARADAATLADAAAAATAERDALRAEILTLRDRYEGRVPVGPVADLLGVVMGRVQATGDQRLIDKWTWMLRAASPALEAAGEAGGVRRDHPLVTEFVAAGVADQVVTAAELAAAGLTLPS